MFWYSMFHKIVCALKQNACVSLHCLLVFSVKSVCLCVSHPVFGKVFRLTDWAVRLPSPRLGCLSGSPSFLFPLSCPPSNHLFSILPDQQGEGYFFLHLPYLSTCIGGPNARIKSAHCSVTLPSVHDESVVHLSPLILKKPHCPLVVG